MKLTLDHIGFVVENLDEVLELFGSLGFSGMTRPHVNPLQKVSASFAPVTRGEDVYMEFLESADENSPISKFLRKRGGGLHHLCFEVDDIEAAMADVERRGFRVTVPVEDCVAYDTNLGRECKDGPSRIAFFLLDKYLLVELIEKGK